MTDPVAYLGHPPICVGRAQPAPLVPAIKNLHPEECNVSAATDQISSQIVAGGVGYEAGGRCGPLNGTYHVPPRPKPGRKTVQDQPPTKRKQQNREAQRSFRARRQLQREQLEKEAISNKIMRQEDLRKLITSEQIRAQQEKTILSLRKSCQTSDAAIQQLKSEVNDLRALLRDAENTISSKDEIIRQLSRPSCEAIAPPRTESGPVQNRGDIKLGPLPTDSVDLQPAELYHPPRDSLPSIESSQASELTPEAESIFESSVAPDALVIQKIEHQRPPVAAHTLNPPPPGSEPGLGLTVGIESLLSPQQSSRAASPAAANPASADLGLNLQYEIDFTNFFKKSSLGTSFSSSDSLFMSDDIDFCGFCTEMSNCVCRSTREMQKANPALDKQFEFSEDYCREDVATPAKSISSEIPRVDPIRRRAPGSCSQCLTNPRQRRFCIELCRRKQSMERSGRTSQEELNTVDSEDQRKDAFDGKSSSSTHAASAEIGVNKDLGPESIRSGGNNNIDHSSQGRQPPKKRMITCAEAYYLSCQPGIVPASTNPRDLDRIYNIYREVFPNRDKIRRLGRLDENDSDGEAGGLGEESLLGDRQISAANQERFSLNELDVCDALILMSAMKSESAANAPPPNFEIPSAFQQIPKIRSISAERSSNSEAVAKHIDIPG